MGSEVETGGKFKNSNKPELDCRKKAPEALDIYFKMRHPQTHQSCRAERTNSRDYLSNSEYEIEFVEAIYFELFRKQSLSTISLLFKYTFCVYSDTERVKSSQGCGFSTIDCKTVFKNHTYCK